MSLINGMLRDLEARRSDGPGSPVFVEQIRAVPAQDKVQRLRWYVLSAVLFLTLAAWIFLRPIEPGKPLKAGAGAPVQEQAQPPAAATPAAATPVAAAAVSAPPVSAAKPAASTVAPVDPVPAQANATLAVKDVVPAIVQTPAEKPAAQPTPVANAKPARKREPLERKLAAAEPADKPRAEAAPAKPAEAATKTGAEPVIVKRNVTLEEANPASTAMGAARLQVERGDVRGAIDTLERSLPEASGRADYHAFLAALLQRDEQHKPAVEHYLVAVQRSPQTGVWWLGLGISRQALQQNAEAQEAFKRARASNTLSAELNAFVDARLAQLQR